jgi:enoyl-[acyl-carrier protein] reductase III
MQTFYDKKYYALILGGSSGIGFATAQKLASEGMNLCIVYRDRKAESKIIEETFLEIKNKYDVEVLTFNADAVEPDSIFEIVQKIKATLDDKNKIRLLLHSVSKGNLKPLVKPLRKELKIENDNIKTAYQIIQEEQLKHQQSEFYLSGTDFQLTLQNMAISLIDWVKIVFENKLFADDARVIGLSSEGNQKAWINYAAVSATKAALEAIIRSLALEYAPYGIRSNIVQAGITETASLNKIPGNELLKSNAVYRNPFGRMTKTEDVANAIYLLCRDEASWINGAVIPVDGGERIC